MVLSEDVSVSTLASRIVKIRAALSVITHIPQFSSIYRNLDPFDIALLEEDECKKSFTQFLCEAVFSRCSYQGCSYPKSANCTLGEPTPAVLVEDCTGPADEIKLCFLNDAVKEWIQCGERFSSSRQDFPLRLERVSDLIEKLQTKLFQVSEESDTLFQFVSEEDLTLLSMFLAQLRQHLRALQNEARNRNCIFMLSESEVVGAPRIGGNSVGCNPHSMFYTSTRVAMFYDSGLVFLLVFVVLTGLVAGLSNRLPMLEFSSKSDRNARIISMVVGITSSSFIFVSAVDYETAAQLSDSQGRLVFQVWASIHLLVTLLMVHHSAFLLVSGPDLDSLPVAMLRSRYKLCDRVVRACHSCTKGDGRFFGLYVILREIVECAVQLMGIDSTARESDHEMASTRAAVLCLNLMLLPIATFIVARKCGDLAALTSVIVVESIFDNLYIAVGVMSQRGASEYVLTQEGSGDEMLPYFVRSAPTLLPALVFCAVDQTPLMVLASISELKSSEQRDASTRRMQPQHRLGSLGRTRGGSAGPIELSVHSPRRGRHFIPRRQCVSLSVVKMMASMLGVVSFGLGITLWYYIVTRVRMQEAICESRVGSIARCMSPRIYNRAGLFADHAECAFDAVTSIDCRGDVLVDAVSGARTKQIPEAPDVYRNMELLTEIDVSDNAALENVPESWSLVPGLRKINVSFCGALKEWPYSLCASPSLLGADGGLDVRGTPISISLNWSGQIMPKTRKNTSQLMSEVCLSVFAPTLESLDLSHNGIQYKNGVGRDRANHINQRMIQQFQWIRELKRLLLLDLSNNYFWFLDSNYFKLVEHVHTNAQSKECKLKQCGVKIVVGNPIKRVHMVAEDSLMGLDLVRHFDGNGNCANRLVYLKFIGMRNQTDSLFEAVRTSCFARKLTLLSFASSGLFSSTNGVVKNGSFESMPNIRTLDLQGNEIVALEPGAFSRLSNLVTLTLRMNNLKPTDALQNELRHLKNLEHLDLSSNKFEFEGFYGYPLTPLRELKTLDLSKNTIGKILNVSEFTELEEFYCEACEMTSIRKDAFSMNRKLGILCLSQNPKLRIKLYERWGIRSNTLTIKLGKAKRSDNWEPACGVGDD